MTKKYIPLIVIVVLLIGLGVWYVLSQSQPQQSPNPTPTSTVSPTPTTGSSQSAAPSNQPTGQAKTFTITGANYAFSPKTIRVNQGDTVIVKFESRDSSHTFTAPDFNVDTGLVSPGQNKTVQFTANKRGTFEFYCIPHRSMGMTGTIVVE